MAKKPLPVPSGTVSMGQVLRGEKQELAARTFGAQVDKDLRRDAKKGEYNFQVAFFITVTSIFLFFALNVYFQRFRYPDLYNWWEANVHKASTPGRAATFVDGDTSYSMNQVCVARDFPPVQSVLQVGVWKNLSPMAAEFLILTVNYFQSNPYVSSGGTATRNKLTAIHWSGSFEQWKGSGGKPPTTNDIIGPNGMLCGGTTGNEDLTINNIQQNWKGSKVNLGNVWVDFFPPDLMDCPVFQSLIAGRARDEGAFADPCSKYSKSESLLFQLLAGGLCYVAKQNQDAGMSGAQLFQMFFSSKAQSTPKTDCSGDTLTDAMKGGAGMGMLGFALASVSPAFAVGAVAMGFAGGAAASHFSAKASCMKYIEPASDAATPITGTYLLHN